MLGEEASNSNFNGHDDLVESPRRSGITPNNASIAAEKIIEITSHDFARLSLMPRWLVV